MDLLDRYRGCLLGLATGDAVGASVEFRPRGSFEPLTDMLGGGPFNLLAGQWTDDTSMALCLATSLLERDGFDARDQMERYCRWADHGYLSSTGTCFDIGGTVAAALSSFQHSGEPYAGSPHPQPAGSGRIMRLRQFPCFTSQTWNPRNDTPGTVPVLLTVRRSAWCMPSARLYHPSRPDRLCEG